MRVELALILGIVFFCCWCAYIVARMNASVSSLGQNAGSTTIGGENNAILANQAYLQQATNRHSSQQHHQQQHHDIWAPVVGEPPPPAPPLEAASTTSASDHDQVARQNNNAGNQYYANNNQHYHRAQLARQQEASAPHPVALIQPTAANSNQFSSFDAAKHQPLSVPQQQELNYNQQQHQLAALENPLQQQVAEQIGGDESPDEQLGDEEDGGEQQAATNDDEADQPDDQEQQQPAPRSELEEVAKRRSFDENENESNERDRNGNLIKTQRRHLINGKPVDGRSSASQGSEQVPTSLTNDSDEFERLVDEIDSDRKEKDGADNDNQEEEEGDGDGGEQQAVTDGQPEEMDENATTQVGPGALERRQDDEQLKNTTSNPTGSNRPADSKQESMNGKVALKPKRTVAKKIKVSKSTGTKPNDSHEHRMHETLSAQQWDDDHSTSKSPPSTIGGGTNDGGADEDEAEEESRRLEELSNDLLLNGANDSEQQDDQQQPANVVDDQELTRRRRSVPIVDLHMDEGRVKSSRADSQLGGDNLNMVNVVHYDDDEDDTIHGQSLSNKTTANRLVNYAPKISSRFGSTNDLGDKNKTVAVKAITNSGGRVSNSLAATNSSLKSSPDSISGQEDISIEVLANPPPPSTTATTNPTAGQPQAHPYQGPSLAYAASVGPNYQLGGGLTQPVVGPPPQPVGDFPRISSPFASESAKKATKKKKTKKKMSKLSNSKYKSAKAYATKLKSKQKKGKMYKKKKKSHKNLKTGKKHFAGSMKGRKSSKGYGHKGAHKGENFFKDKGYKKRGFKKVYHKMETGDHKTYFDEFRDKDHNKKWKKFDDKHKYSKKKKWAGNDMRHLDHHKLDESKGKSSKDGRWKEKHSSKHMKKAHKLKKSKKAMDSEGFKKKKKKKEE